MYAKKSNNKKLKQFRAFLKQYLAKKMKPWILLDHSCLVSVA